MVYSTEYQANYGPRQAEPSAQALAEAVHSNGVQLIMPVSPVAAGQQHRALPAAPLSLPPFSPARSSTPSLIAAQADLTDDEALALALSKDEHTRAQQEKLELDEQYARMCARVTSARCIDDHAVAVAVAAQEQQAAADAGGAYAASMYPEVLMESKRDAFMNKLTRLPSIQLRPRVNQQRQTFTDHITDDRARVLARLTEYGLMERVVQGDGACQFRSLSDQLYGSPDHHAFVRDMVLRQLVAHPRHYEQYVPQTFGDYIAEMTKPTTWGDHVTLQAAADCYGLRIVVLTSFKEAFVLAIEPTCKQSHRVLWLSFWAEVHYNSLYPQEEPPGSLEQEELQGTAKVLGSKKLARLLHAAR